MATVIGKAPQRTHESRESQTRAQVGWMPPAMLDAPPPRPGYRQRWIATSILGKDESANVSRRLREGWEPRKVDTLPEDWKLRAPTLDHGKFAGYVGVEGMLLCEMPEELVRQRTNYYRDITSAQQQYVGEQLARTAREGGIPIEQESSTKVVHGVSVPVMND
jgi:hypothetical protein